LYAPWFWSTTEFPIAAKSRWIDLSPHIESACEAIPVKGLS
jgi:hypothetical protein